MLLRLAQIVIIFGFAFFIAPALGGKNPMANNIAGMLIAWGLTIILFKTIDGARALRRWAAQRRANSLPAHSRYTPGYTTSLPSDRARSTEGR